MRKWLPLVVAVVFTGQLVAAEATLEKFAGKWKMDPTRSESAHQDVPMGPSTVVIRVAPDAVTIETTRVDSGAPEFHETLNFKPDGSETVSTGEGGTAVKGKLKLDGPRLVVETVRDLQDSTVTTRYVHTLSASGRDLTIDKTLAVQHGYMGRSAPTTGRGKDVFVRVD